MVNLYWFRVLHFVVLLLLFAPFASGADNSNFYSQSQKVDALGSNFSAGMVTGVASGTNQVQSIVGLGVLGLVFEAMMAMSNPPNTIDGVTYTEVYGFGKRIFSGTSYVSGIDGGITAGILPTEIRAPLLIYPVGPVTLEIDGGARVMADVSVQNMSVIGIPASLSSLGVTMSADASAAGFLEGYAKLLVIRGGVGGQLDIIDAQSNLNARITFDGNKPLVMINAMVQFLKGRVYAFLDYFNLFSSNGWTRLLDNNLYLWNGYCYSFGNLSCPAK